MGLFNFNIDMTELADWWEDRPKLSISNLSELGGKKVQRMMRGVKSLQQTGLSCPRTSPVSLRLLILSFTKNHETAQPGMQWGQSGQHWVFAPQTGLDWPCISFSVCLLVGKCHEEIFPLGAELAELSVSLYMLLQWMVTPRITHRTPLECASPASESFMNL